MNAHDFVGLSIIILGFLVKRYPNLIAGFNTLPQEQKEKVDIKGLSKVHRNTMIAMGILLIISNKLVTLLELNQEIQLFSIVSILGIGSGYLVISAQIYVNKASDSKSQSRIRKFGKYLVFAILLLIPYGIMMYGRSSPNFIIANDQLEISGMYGLTVNIKAVKRLETLPPILKRTNGFGMGSIKRGNFNLAEIGQCKLFLESLEGPFIYIETNDGTPVIINTGAKAKTEELLAELQQQVL
ncbi:MAG: DUF3784 domain-containing protein [Bacteroidota bacterium]